MEELNIRPEYVKVDGEKVPLFSRDEKYEEVADGVYVREWQHKHMSGETDWIGIEEDTTMVAYGDTKMSTVFDLGHATGRYREQLANQLRPNEVVIEDETPKIEGTRIEVLTLYRAAKKYDSLAVVSSLYTLPLVEVVNALEWVNDNEETFERALALEQLYDDWVSEYWTERTWGYERPDNPEVNFEEYRRQHEDFEE